MLDRLRPPVCFSQIDVELSAPGYVFTDGQTTQKVVGEGETNDNGTQHHIREGKNLVGSVFVQVSDHQGNDGTAVCSPMVVGEGFTLGDEDRRLTTEEGGNSITIFRFASPIGRVVHRFGGSPSQI